MISPPALFGHELAGDIVAVGEDVKSFSVGQRVVAANSAPCGKCFYCRKKLENLARTCCSTTAPTPSTSAFPPASSKRTCYVIPDHVTYQDAALIEPLACVLRGLEETGIRPGDTVAIIGLGPIGLMFVRLAKVYGARVIAIGRRHLAARARHPHGRR